MQAAGRAIGHGLIRGACWNLPRANKKPLSVPYSIRTNGKSLGKPPAKFGRTLPLQSPSVPLTESLQKWYIVLEGGGVSTAAQ